MGQLKKLFVLCLCVVLANCETKAATAAETHETSVSKIEKSPTSATEDEVKVVKKRQLLPFPGYGDYYDLFLEYAAYDYYDWVCTDTACQLCDVLTGACCNPLTTANCFLPDSCANNPCLSGGTCISTTVIGGFADFVCTCRQGLTGKYCQLRDEFSAPPIVPIPVPIPVPGPGPGPAPQPPAPQRPYPPPRAPYPSPQYPPQPPAYKPPKQPYYPPQPNPVYGPAPYQPTPYGRRTKRSEMEVKSLKKDKRRRRR